MVAASPDPTGQGAMEMQAERVWGAKRRTHNMGFHVYAVTDAWCAAWSRTGVAVSVLTPCW